MAEPRRRTVAFRVTEAERQTIDSLARRVGLGTSEYARRVALDVATISTQALDAVRDEGRAEVRRELTGTQDALARTVGAYNAWRSRAEALGQVEVNLLDTRKQLASMSEACSLLRRKVETLEAAQHRAPEELVMAVKQLIAGAPGARAEVAQVWAGIRPSTSDREKILPIIAAEVADAIESIVTRFPTNGDAFARWPILRRRIEWLFDGLHLDAGTGYRRGGGTADAVWKPVVEALDDADEERGRYAADFVDT